MRVLPALRALAEAITIIVVGVVLGKSCQYLAVAHFGSRIGFDAASAIGLVPLAGVLLALNARYPQVGRLLMCRR